MKCIHHKKHGEEGHHPKWKIYYIRIKVIPLIIYFRRNKSIFAIGRCKYKKGASVSVELALFNYIYLFIAIALDESILFDVLHFPMKNIKSCDLEAMPMGGATSKPTSDVVCWRDVGRVSP